MGGVSTNYAEFWHFTYYMRGHTGRGNITLWLRNMPMSLAYLHLPLTQFLLSPSNITNPLLIPVWVWQCHIQYLHCNPNHILMDNNVINIFFYVFTFHHDQQSVLFIKFLYYHWLCSCMLID